MMTINRRSFLKLLLASAVAEAADWDKLLWVPKPIVTVPAMPVVGYINSATYVWWRNHNDPRLYECRVDMIRDLFGKAEAL